MLKRNSSVVFLLVFFILSSCRYHEKLSYRNIKPKAETKPLPGIDTAQECTLWHHAGDRSKTIVIGNDKSENGGLYVWDLNGNLLHMAGPLNQPMGLSVRYQIPLLGEKIDVVACVLKSNDEIKIYKIHPITRDLINVTTSKGIKTGFLGGARGLCLYKRPSDGQLFAFVFKDGSSVIHQIKLVEDGNGRIKGIFVRKFGKGDQHSFIQGIVADDELGYVYCTNEEYSILKYHADPDLKTDPFIRSFGQLDSTEGDQGGLALYRMEEGKGYLVVSSKGDSSFKIYNREGKNPYIKTVVLEGVSQTNGIAISSYAAPPKYPSGVFVTHNDEKNNYMLYDWFQFSLLR